MPLAQLPSVPHDVAPWSGQLVAQQTPPTHCELAQVAPVLQVPPLAVAGSQTLPTQTFPPEHSLFVVHDTRHVVAPHAYGAQLTGVPGGLHVPVPLHSAAGVAAPLLHDAAAPHCVVAG